MFIIRIFFSSHFIFTVIGEKETFATLLDILDAVFDKSIDV